MRPIDERVSARRRTLTRRTALLGAMGTGVFTVLGGRLYELQVTDNEQYLTLSDDNRFYQLVTPPSRGRILDRYGAVIADNIENYQVFAVPAQLDDVEASAHDILTVLSPHGDVDAVRARVLVERLRAANPLRPVLVAENIDWHAFARAHARRAELPGFVAQMGETRAYGIEVPGGGRRSADAFAHVVGYVSKPSGRIVYERMQAAQSGAERRRLVRELNHPAARVGREGLESSLDGRLAGQWGELRVEMDARGQILREIGLDEEPRAGQDVQLTLDAEVQAYAQERLYGESGAAAAIDVRTGEIMCLVSAPAFDPNLFVGGINDRAFRALLNDVRDPLYNKPLSGLYAPGSTFKMVTALAALQAGVVTPEDRVFCSGKIRLGRREFHCWKREGHGFVDMRRAIKESCDCYFYEMALRLFRRRGAADGIEQVAFPLGLGERAFDLEVPGGFDGVLPGPAYDARVRDDNRSIPGFNDGVDAFNRSRSVPVEDFDSGDEEAARRRPREGWYIARVERFVSMMDAEPLPSAAFLGDESLRPDDYNAQVEAYNRAVRRHNELAREFNSEIISYGNQFRFKRGMDVRLPRLSLGDRLNEAIGQGYVLASPLQLAVMTARIATGRSVSPSIIRGGARGPGDPIAEVDPEYLALVRDAMFSVVEEPGGTAYYALGYKGIDLPDVRMAGKTGSSQVFRITEEERRSGVRSQAELPWNRRDHGLFVAYAPYDAPRYAIALIVAHGGGGSTAAARPARDILKRILERDPKPLTTLSGAADLGELG